MRNILLINLLIICTAFASDFQCRDENNNPVDWFVVYKLPLLHNAAQSSVRQGKGYMFITDTSIDEGWQLSDETIDSNDTLIANTISFLQDQENENLLWLSYNDQGVIECETCGHTKGFVAGDSSGGFWLIHSIPHYLKDEYPISGFKYGQSAICISLNKTYLNSIGELLMYNKPNFQKWNINSQLKVLYPKIIAAVNKVAVKAPYSLQIPIVSKGGVEFQGFAKSRDFHADLYQWVAKSLSEDLYTETWINEAGVLPSNCDDKYRVINVLFMANQKLGLSYSSHKDHSKLAIAANNSKPWVCIGDINRAKSQEHRGGGTVCINSYKLWKSYYYLINSTEECLNNEIN